MNEKKIIENLLIKRIKCIGHEDNHYIGSPYKPGDILYADRDGFFAFYHNGHKCKFYPEKYPHLFRILNWWEDRKLGDMPLYVKFHAPLPEKYNVGKVEKWEIYPELIKAVVKSDNDAHRRELSIRDEPATEEEYLNYKIKKEIMISAIELLPGLMVFTVPKEAIDVSVQIQAEMYWAFYDIKVPGHPADDHRKPIGRFSGDWEVAGTDITEEVALAIVPQLKFDVLTPACWKNYESEFSGSVLNNAKDSLISLLRSKRIDIEDQDVKYVFITLKSTKAMPDFLIRLKEEYEQLRDRTSKLETFLNGKKIKDLEPAQASLLSIQYVVMKTYLKCLEERIVRIDATYIK